MQASKFIATIDRTWYVTGAYEVPAEYILKNAAEVYITEAQYAQWQLITTVQQAQAQRSEHMGA